MNDKKKIWIQITIAVGIVVLIYFGLSLWYTDHFFPGTYINGYDSTNRSSDEVRAKLQENMEEYTLTIRASDGSEEEILGDEIDFAYDYSEIDTFLERQDAFQWIKNIFIRDDYNIEKKGLYSEEKLDRRIALLNCLTRPDSIASENARIENDDQGLRVIPEVYGNQVDSIKLREQIQMAVSEGKTELDLQEIDCYIKPVVTTESPDIKAAFDAIQSLSNMTITYDFGYTSESVGPDIIRTWVDQNEDGEYVIDRDLALQFVYGLAERHDTVWRPRSFNATLQGTITVPGGTYGWDIDPQGETDQLMADLAAHTDVTRAPVAYMDPFPGAKEDNDIGKTYVEIDISAQHMWYYRDGGLVLETDVTTGTMNDEMATPAGVYYIVNRIPNAVLVGDTYRTRVNYWMEVYRGVGIHDALWRSTFGGTYYLTDGSHGCINTPLDKVTQLFQTVEVGTPVIMYY